MKNEELYISELKSILLSRRRQGGELITLKNNDFQSAFPDDLREYMTSEVLGMVGKNSYCFIAEKSTAESLIFLDVSRGIRKNGNMVEILGYFYENGQVESYVIDRFNIDEENNG